MPVYNAGYDIHNTVSESERIASSWTDHGISLGSSVSDAHCHQQPHPARHLRGRWRTPAVYDCKFFSIRPSCPSLVVRSISDQRTQDVGNVVMPPPEGFQNHNEQQAPPAAFETPAHTWPAASQGKSPAKKTRRRGRSNGQLKWRDPLGTDKPTKRMLGRPQEDFDEDGKLKDECVKKRDEGRKRAKLGRRIKAGKVLSTPSSTASSSQ